MMTFVVGKWEDLYTRTALHKLLLDLSIRLRHLKLLEMYMLPRYNWNIVESGIKHHKPTTTIEMYMKLIYT